MAVIKSNRAKIVAGLILGATMLASSSFASGNDLAIPHEFFSGDATSAIHVNENFSAIEVAVNGIGSRIKMLESDTAKPVFQGFPIPRCLPTKVSGSYRRPVMQPTAAAKFAPRRNMPIQSSTTQRPIWPGMPGCWLIHSLLPNKKYGIASAVEPAVPVALAAQAIAAINMV
jgi:hypothetical protein